MDRNEVVVGSRKELYKEMLRINDCFPTDMEQNRILLVNCE
jgi:hypothetical protein